MEAGTTSQPHQLHCVIQLAASLVVTFCPAHAAFCRGESALGASPSLLDTGQPTWVSIAQFYEEEDSGSSRSSSRWVCVAVVGVSESTCHLLCAVLIRPKCFLMLVSPAGAAAVAACVQTGSASPTVPILSFMLAGGNKHALLHQLRYTRSCCCLHFFVFLDSRFLSALTAKQSVRSITFQSEHKCACALFGLPMFIQFHVIFTWLCNLSFRDFVRDPSL
jgi:hypothetical protein